MSKSETATDVAARLQKKLSDIPYDGVKDVPVSLSISLPKSLVRRLEERRLQNKEDDEGPKTLSGLIKASLEKDGYGSL
jgi:uncharacterized protein (DUF2267 family)